MANATMVIGIFEDQITMHQVQLVIKRLMNDSSGLANISLINCFYRQLEDAPFASEALEIAMQYPLVLLGSRSGNCLRDGALNWVKCWVSRVRIPSTLALLTTMGPVGSPGLVMEQMRALTHHSAVDLFTGDLCLSGLEDLR
jgi:hypothetical protein